MSGELERLEEIESAARYLTGHAGVSERRWVNGRWTLETWQVPRRAVERLSAALGFEVFPDQEAASQ
jgi:hypothetical protein